MDSLQDYFGADSPFAAHLSGFQPRAGQSWMADAVAQAIDESGKLVVEAGTGTGKTLAYLLPALLAAQKTIISTGTKALQDQLYHRDLPLVGKVIGRPVKTALLKGRANYLCLQRLEVVDDKEISRPALRDLKRVREWRFRTQSGDRAELTEVAEDSSVWPRVTSTADNCLGSECAFFKECHVVAARRQAQEADLVVVNHHLLLADLAMKEEGFVEFLPDADAIILDEAHQLPDLAAQFFGISLGTRELERVVEEARAATLASRDADIGRQLDELATSLRVLRADAPRKEGRYEFGQVLGEIRPALERLRAALVNVESSVAPIAESSIELEKLRERLTAANEHLALLISEDTWDGLRWLEVHARSLRLHLTPLDVADSLGAMINNGDQAWVFTSATLAIGEDFSHFTSRMGVTDATGLTFPSPYDLKENGMVWLPAGLPQPGDASHTGALLDKLQPLLHLTHGGVFCLFTSYRALNAARDWFDGDRDRAGDRPVLVQGDAPRDDLLRRFRRHGNAVLLGTSSFWEGVDVRGEALTVVAIDKLPFASPGDPLMMARLEFIRRQGGNAFMEHQLPQAVLALKQGAGRLLRDDQDYGVIVLCDPRIRSKQYGKAFLECLAPMPVTENLHDVRDFFARHESASSVADTG